MKLNFRTYGDGPPLLILHGLLGSLDNWTTLAKKFGEHFKTYIIDQRNHGQSPHSDEMNLDVMAEDLLELMDGEEIERAHIIGHSMGGKVGIRVAEIQPERVDKLVIVDIAPRAYPPGHEDVFAGLQAVDPAKLQSREAADAILAQHVPDLGTRQFLLKNLTRDESGGFRWRINLPGILGAYDNINVDAYPSSPLNGPTLFVSGAKSDYISKEDMEEISRFFSNVQFATIANAGHWVHANAPVDFEERVSKFLLS